MSTAPPSFDLPSDAPRFHVLAKPTGAVCNLDCTYCFYLEKESLYPQGGFRMGEDVLDAYLRQIIEVHRDQPVVPVAWQGGEPTLMGLDFYRRVIGRLQRLLPAGQQLEHTLQTNGVRLDDEWCAFLAEHQILVGLSIDGPKDIHDAYRKDKGGRGTFDQVVRAAHLLRRHGVEVNALVTVHAMNQDRGREVYRFLRDELGFRFIQLIPIVERLDPDGIDLGGIARGGIAGFSRQDAPVTDRTVSPEGWGRFLCEIFDEWVRNDVGTVFLPTFEAALAAWMGMQPSMCIFRETCGDAVALEHNGDLYSCDHYVTPTHRLGNILEQHMATLVASADQRAFGCKKLDALPPQCRRCTVRFACNGACPKDRFLADEGGHPGLSWLCAGYYAFFTHIDAPMKLLADRVRRGLPAEGVMPAMQALADPVTAGLGRNDPCPCGSGRKWKHCHGARS